MLRGPLARAAPAAAKVIFNTARGTATKAPEKIEVFVDDKPVMVDPGTTVLQVISGEDGKLIEQTLFEIVIILLPLPEV